MDCKSTMRSKIRGTLLAATMGDCFGHQFEWKPAAQQDKAVIAKFLNDMTTGSQEIPLQTYSDDTAQMREVARSLLATGGQLDPADMARRLVQEWERDIMRKCTYGGLVPFIFYHLKKSNYADPYKPARQPYDGKGSFGNGAAMRCAPLACFGMSLPDTELVKLVQNASRITHAHHLGYNGAVLLVLAIRQALLIKDIKNLDVGMFLQRLIYTMRQLEDELSEKTQDRSLYSQTLEGMKDLLTSGAELSPEKIAAKFGNDVSAQESVLTAIYIALLARNPIKEFNTDNPLMRALFLAFAVGGDTDTIGCMTGALVGALYGDAVIQPAGLLDYCEEINSIEDIAEQITEFLHSKLVAGFTHSDQVTKSSFT